MPQPSVVTVVKGRALRNEIDDALINPSAELSSTAMLSNKGGGKGYVPAYRAASQSAGGSEAFAPSVKDDGTITFFLEAGPAPEIAAAGGATAASASPSFALVLHASGAGARFALKETREGGAISRLSVQLSGDNLREARAELFDTSPNVAIEVSQTVKIAAQQTQAFVYRGWSNPAIRQGLIDLFQIPFDSAETYFMMANGGDPDFPNQYMVMNCVYKTQSPAPPLPGYLQWQVNWQNRAYNYYQDNRDRTRVFYLPDRFDFAKGPAGSPTVSLLQFTLPEGPATADRTRATFRLYGNPVVDLNRVQNAAQVLKDRVGGLPQMVSLQDAHNAALTFTQYLPNAEASGSNPAVQKDAHIDLATGMRNELDLNFAQFRALWAAIFSADQQNPLFRGWVEVQLSDGKFKDRIDFNGRLPKDRETSFFDDILDTSTKSTFPAQFTLKTVKKTFEGDPAPVAIELTFAGGRTVSLDATKLEAQIQVERSIRDIVLGNQSPDEYPYKMRVIRDDGTAGCCEGTAKSDSPTLWILRDQIAKCTGGCS